MTDEYLLTEQVKIMANTCNTVKENTVEEPVCGQLRPGSTGKHGTATEIMKYELTEAQGEMEKKKENAQAGKVVLKAARRRSATAGGRGEGQNRMTRGGEDGESAQNNWKLIKDQGGNSFIKQTKDR